jgi:hypothetical protein
VADSREAGEPEDYVLDPVVLREGRNVLAIEIHNQAIDSGDLSLIPELVLHRGVIVDAGAEWSYRRGNEGIPADWASLTFNDSSWMRGPSGLGFGDGDDATEVPGMQGSTPSLFCRHRFPLSAEQLAFQAFELALIYDDGVVVHLNGEELGRADMAGGAIGPASTAGSSGDFRVARIPVERSRLRQGENLLAISVHNATLESSDLSLVPFLVARVSTPPALNCSPGFVRGDANGDRALDIGDPLRVLFHVFRGAPKAVCEDAADANDDGRIEMGDAIAILSHLFRGGSALAAPGATCGPDPSADALAECEPGCQ